MRFLLAVFIAFLPGSASALNLSARLTASLHSWERQDDDSTSVAQNTIHQLVSLKIADVGVKGLSFHAYGRGFIHAEDSESRRRLALYSTYADWKGIARRLDLRIGRQRVFAGVGRGTFDGAQASLSLPLSVELLAYAGAETPQDRSTRVRSWDEGHLYGFRASVRRWRTTLSLSFANESRPALGLTAEEAGESEQELTTLARRLLGGEVRSAYLRRAELYGRVDIDAIAWEPARVQLRGSGKASPGLSVSAELDYRAPAIDANSFLSVFPLKANTEIEGAAAYLMRDRFQLNGSYSVVLFAGDETHRLRLGLSRGRSAFGYYRRSGYGGERDGLTFASGRAITPQVSLRGSLNFSTYRLSETSADRDQALSGVLALDYARTDKLAVSVEGHVLENKTYDYDLRLFAKVTWWIDVET